MLFDRLSVPAETVTRPPRVLTAFVSESVPAPDLMKSPAPSSAPESVSVVAPPSIWNRPAPPAAMVNSLLLVTLAEFVYSSVPVEPPDLPRMTERALLPSGPAVAWLLTVAVASVPFSTVNCPENVLAPASSQVLEPVFVTAPAPVPMMLARLLTCDDGPLPPSVRAKPVPEIVPAFVMPIAPLSATMLLSLVRVMRPPKLAGPAFEFMSAPAAETPVPLSVNASAVVKARPFKSRAAPVAAITVPAAVVPSGEFVPLPAPPSRSTPAFTVVRPV